MNAHLQTKSGNCLGDSSLSQDHAKSCVYNFAAVGNSPRLCFGTTLFITKKQLMSLSA